MVTTKVLATIYLAELTDYGWDESGNAYVKMALDVQAVSEILGKEIVDSQMNIEVEGVGAEVDDFAEVRLGQ